MIKQIGTKIYYCNITGNVIKIIGDMQGYVKETNFDEDYLIYQELNEREKETIGLIEIEFGQYLVLSKDSTGAMVNLETKELIFTYEPMPVPPPEPTWEEKLENKISVLEEENKAQDELINISMLATDEMFTMIEPLLAQSQINLKTKGGSKMVDMYVAMCQRGLKTVEEVPVRYRDEVRRILKELEK